MVKVYYIILPDSKLSIDSYAEDEFEKFPEYEKYFI